MKKSCLSLAVVLCLAACALGQSDSNIHALRPFNGGTLPPQSGTISYNGGPIFEKTPTVYIVYYGTWTKKDKSVIDGYFTNLTGSTMNKINTKYSDSANKFVPVKLNHSTKNDYHDNYSMGKSLSGDAAIHTLVKNAIKGGHLPADVNGIYFVLTAKDVSFPGMCTQLCGYHSPATDIVSGDVIKYSMVGNPAQCPSACEASQVVGDGGKSPNNDPGADGTVNIMWHEFSETVSDPEVNLQTAWAGSCGESGDCCAWFFGTLKTAPNGSHYTNKLSGKYYIAQTMLELNGKARGQNEPATCKNTF